MSNKKIYYLLTNGHIAKITKDYIRKQNKNYKANQHKFQKGITYGYNDYQSLENILKNQLCILILFQHYRYFIDIHTIQKIYIHTQPQTYTYGHDLMYK